MSTGIAPRDGIDIAYESIGSPTGDPLLLIMDTAAQVLYWPDEFCAALANQRFQVRGSTTGTPGCPHTCPAGIPRLWAMLTRPASAAVYRLEDLAGPGQLAVPRFAPRGLHGPRPPHTPAQQPRHPCPPGPQQRPVLPGR